MGGGRAGLLQPSVPVPGGRTQRIAIGRVNTPSPDDARKQTKLILVKAQTGGDPQAKKAEARRQASITRGSVTDSYLNQAKGRLKPRSFAEVDGRVCANIGSRWRPFPSRPFGALM